MGSQFPWILIDFAKSCIFQNNVEFAMFLHRKTNKRYLGIPLRRYDSLADTSCKINTDCTMSEKPDGFFNGSSRRFPGKLNYCS